MDPYSPEITTSAWLVCGFMKLSVLLCMVALLIVGVPVPVASTETSTCAGYAHEITAHGEYTIPSGRTQTFDQPTAIIAPSVRIDGILQMADATPGNPAPDLCIETSSLTIGSTGKILTGHGAEGSSNSNSIMAQGGPGTNGGSVNLDFVQGASPDSPTFSIVRGGHLITGAGGAGGDVQLLAYICNAIVDRHAFGGIGGDAGALRMAFDNDLLYNIAPFSVMLGNGGDGGNALALGGLRRQNDAVGGSGGVSDAYVNGASIGRNAVGLKSLGLDLQIFGASKGGAGGDAIAITSPSCNPNSPCNNMPWTNQTYCLLHDVLNLVCTSPTSTYCNWLYVLDLVGTPGDGEEDYATGADPADPGYNGQDAADGADWQTECGVGVTAEPPYGETGCSASVSCGAGHDAQRGFYGQGGYTAASAIAKGKIGGFGILLGGTGGQAVAHGAHGGLGGQGGSGGAGAAGCLQDSDGGAGARGGNGGAGGQGTAQGGDGGPSSIQGGKGGDVNAIAGTGGTGGPGGSGGAPAAGCNPYTGTCQPFSPGGAYNSKGGTWGCGGGGGARGGLTSARGDGGVGILGIQNGPNGVDVSGQQPTPYGAPGAHGPAYLPNSACNP